MTTTGQQARRPEPSRGIRADARRNIDRLLDAAERAFAEEGLGVPVDVIAARAGVGVGTLYRHFPTKEALFKAVVATRLRALADKAKELLKDPDPGRALFSFVAEVAALAMKKRDLTDELARAGIDAGQLHLTVRDELEKALGLLLKRAQEVKAVRTDVTTPELVALLMGTCMAAQMRGEAMSPSHLVRVVCDGLRNTVKATSAPGVGSQLTTAGG